ncbi:pre-mRNA-splicing factor CWC22 homolog [Melanaphis sacchari]|uniref:pre-mRNA-splicing factor CWC22 homolog n=1 Tax=Melanaphis sacchari TaxID=742174 RepID=UPI000DC13FBC|nr:pre-mRNA-splicing factor CWC22 homolog [Melanaphis sacchari]
MDQEGNGRRRSSRLAAKGVVTTPKSENIVKKTLKTSEKPKRSKRKTTEETIELPEAKKTKTEDNASSDKVDNPGENEIKEETNDTTCFETKVDCKIIDTEKELSGVSSLNADNVETNVSPPSEVEKKDLPTVEEKTDAPLEDSKNQKVVEKPTVTNDEKEKDNMSVEIEDKKPEIAEEIIKMKDPEVTEKPKNDVSQDEPKQEPVALENSNGENNEKKIESVEEIVNNDIGFCVATKDDIVTPNGDTDEQVKSTNGDQSIVEKEAIEPIKVLNDDTNHVETDLKAVTTTTAITTNNDVPIVEEVEKELDKATDNVVDNISASADDNAPNVDQLSTVVS